MRYSYVKLSTKYADAAGGAAVIRQTGRGYRQVAGREGFRRAVGPLTQREALDAEGGDVRTPGGLTFLLRFGGKDLPVQVMAGVL